MLDRTKVAQQLEHLSPVLFTGRRTQPWLTKAWWRRVVQDPAFLQRIDRVRGQQRLVAWRGALDAFVVLPSILESYAVFAVDGSQIYPEKHLEGVECFLINAAGCFLAYEPLMSFDRAQDERGQEPARGKQSFARFFSEPEVYIPAHFEGIVPGFSTDVVDLVREEKEFLMMAAQYDTLAAAADGRQMAALFDGNLLFWHLEAKMPSVRDLFLLRYLRSLEELYQRRALIAGYLSSPGFHDLGALLTAGLAAGVGDLTPEQRGLLEQLTDAELLTHVLEPGERTTIFFCDIPLVEQYPPHLQPAFVYLHVGIEIVRLEFPAWIAADNTLVDWLCSVCLDQCTKGNGYPVALAEAHANAVVKSADRDFFYHLIYKLALTRQQRVFFSPKSLKKKMMGI